MYETSSRDLGETSKYLPVQMTMDAIVARRQGLKGKKGVGFSWIAVGLITLTVVVLLALRGNPSSGILVAIMMFAFVGISAYVGFTVGNWWGGIVGGVESFWLLLAHAVGHDVVRRILESDVSIVGGARILFAGGERLFKSCRADSGPPPRCR